MALTDAKIRAAKPRAKPYKLADEKGLFLLVQPSGGRLWRFKHRKDGKEQKLSLGVYPDIGLKEAREKLDAARKLLAAGVDPAAARRQAQAAQKINAITTFKVVGDEFISKMEREGRAAGTLDHARWYLRLLDPVIGATPVADVTPPELLAALKTVEARGTHETAKKMMSFSSRVFRFAIASGWRYAANPADALGGALTSPKVRHRAAILEPKRVGELLRALEGYSGQASTRAALNLAPHVFVRPGELRHAEWGEFDFENGIWTIPAGKMKMRQPHVVPLSNQAVAILKAQAILTGRGRYVFPSVRTSQRPMSENTLTAALRRLGYTTDEMTAHGFRSIASTLLNESGKWHPDAIERALAHKDSDAVRAAYHRGQHWNERVEMAQWWSDYLDELRDGPKMPVQLNGDEG